MITHHFCPIPFIRIESLCLVHAQGMGFVKTQTTEGGASWKPSEELPTTDENVIVDAVGNIINKVTIS